MSKHARVEAIRKLKEQLQLANDPDTVLKITNQIARLTPKPRQARRPRVTPTPIRPKKTSDLVAKRADRLDHLPEEKQIEVAVILEVEEKRKKPGCADIRSVLTEVVGMLSAKEGAVLNAESTGVA